MYTKTEIAVPFNSINGHVPNSIPIPHPIPLPHWLIRRPFYTERYFCFTLFFIFLLNFDQFRVIFPKWTSPPVADYLLKQNKQKNSSTIPLVLQTAGFFCRGYEVQIVDLKISADLFIFFLILIIQRFSLSFLEPYCT